MKHSLHGRKILITRERKQAVLFAEKIRQHDGDPVIADLLTIDCVCNEKNKDLLENAGWYDWLFFTSANGVHCFFEMVKDARKETLQKLRMAVVGSKTEMTLRKYGREADFVPSVFNAETMAKEFMALYPANQSVLLIQGKQSRTDLTDAFTVGGRAFANIKIYETKTNETAGDLLNTVLSEKPPQFITFTSPSTVEAFVALAGKGRLRTEPVTVCIGTTTKRSATDAGFHNIIVPSTFTVEGMIEKMSDYIEGGNQHGQSTI